MAVLCLNEETEMPAQPPDPTFIPPCETKEHVPHELRLAYSN